MDKNTLISLINSDPLGLLNITTRTATSASEEDRLIEAFLKINNHYANHGREPQKEEERQLFNYLQSFRKHADKRKVVISFDEYNLLGNPKDIEIPAVETINDIFTNDPLGLLSDNSAPPLSPKEDIFTLKHVPQTMPEYVAQRQKCEDFKDFETLFKQCHEDLKEGFRRIIPFSKGGQIRKGLFYILKGIILYVAEVGKKRKINGATNARLRCIFENGTESDILLRSLAAELYKDGRGVTERQDNLMNGFYNVTEDDEASGFIYVARSLNENVNIKSIKNLYKIGFTRKTIEERLKDVSSDPTFLMSRASLIKAYKCFNMNSQLLEKKMHTFFGEVCLSIDVYDKNGVRHTPREWFIAPIEAIDQAIHLFIAGEIHNYRYDAGIEAVVGK